MISSEADEFASRFPDEISCCKYVRMSNLGGLR
jgi:hypothetical protein